MPTYTVTAPDGRTVKVTGATPPTKEKLDAIFKALPPASASGSKAADLAKSSLPVVVPAARRAAEVFAKAPEAWKTGKVVGEIVGGLAGLAKGGPVGAATGMWAGGKVGWRLTNALQRMAGPVGQALGIMQPAALPISAMGFEGDVLKGANSPEAIARLAMSMTPAAQQQLLAHFQGQPDVLAAIQQAMTPPRSTVQAMLGLGQ